MSVKQQQQLAAAAAAQMAQRHRQMPFNAGLLNNLPQSSVDSVRLHNYYEKMHKSVVSLRSTKFKGSPVKGGRESSVDKEHVRKIKNGREGPDKQDNHFKIREP